MTTFDRYLLTRYLYVNLVLLVAVLGLFAVIDGFVNLDEFQLNALDPGTRRLNPWLLAENMVVHYAFQSLAIFDLAGPSMLVLSAMITLALMLKQGEIHPLLAAGVPIYRVTLVLLGGVVVVNALLILNQEFALPRAAPYLAGNRGDVAGRAQSVRTQYDPTWRVFVSGESAIPGERRLHRPELLLPAPALVDEYVTLKADDAIFFPPSRNQPGGWLLINPVPPVQELPLTDQGRQFLVADRRGTQAFARLTITFDQLNSRHQTLRTVPMGEIARRLQQPVGSPMQRRASLIHLHARLTQPLLTIIGLYTVIPLICIRDRISPMQQVSNLALCATTVSAIYALSLASQFLGQYGMLSPELAVWLPLILGAAVSGWLSGLART